MGSLFKSSVDVKHKENTKHNGKMEMKGGTVHEN